MKKFIIDDMADVAVIMIGKVLDGCRDVTFIGKFEDVSELIKELLLHDEPFPFHIELEAIEIGGYDKEYLVTLDGDLNVWCEKAYQEEREKYLEVDTGCVLIADDCNSALLNKVYSDEIFEVSYYFENELDSCGCDGNCDCCEFSKNDDIEQHETVTRVATDENGKLRGFEKSWDTKDGNMNYHTTYSFFSNNENMLKDMLNNFDIKF